jgi:hypothetical protein
MPMASHVRALAVLQIVYSSFGLLAGITVFLIFGGAALIAGITVPIDDKLVAVPVLAIVGGAISSVVILLSLPRFIAGIGLLRPGNWAKILTFVVSVLGLLDLPFGTALGIYGLWVLTHRDTPAVFGEMPAGAPVAGR